MAVETHAKVTTANASRYLQQLCKHWSHKFAVVFDAASGNVPFPDGGLLRMTATPDTLLVSVSAPDATKAVMLQGVTERHLDRFAFREAPLGFAWSAPMPEPL